MTTDRYNEEIFLGYLEGDLTPQQTVEFEKLMVEDPRLRNLVAQMVLDRHRLRKMPDEPPPAEVMQAARESLERQMLLTPHKTNGGEPTPARRLLLSRWITYASLAAMIVLIAGLVVRTLTDQPILSMSKKQDAKHDAKIAKADLGKNKANSPAPLVAMSPASTSNDKDSNAESLDQRSPERLTGEGASLARTAAPSPDQPDATLAKRQLTSVESKDSLMKEFTGGGKAVYADRAPSGQAGAASVAMMQPPAAPATKPAAPRDAAPKSAPRERVFISRYVNEDVPLPPPWDAVTNDAGAPQQLQLTAESREAGEKEIRAWASANHATVLTVATDQEPVAARAAAKKRKKKG